MDDKTLAMFQVNLETIKLMTERLDRIEAILEREGLHGEATDTQGSAQGKTGKGEIRLAAARGANKRTRASG